MPGEAFGAIAAAETNGRNRPLTAALTACGAHSPRIAPVETADRARPIRLIR
jgi:hypothetical protein